jgi:hypothetical protein
MPRLREALRHPLVTEFVHEDERAVHEVDKYRVQDGRDCAEPAERRGGVDATHGCQSAGDTRFGRASLARQSDLPVHCPKCGASSGGTVLDEPEKLQMPQLSAGVMPTLLEMQLGKYQAVRAESRP